MRYDDLPRCVAKWVSRRTGDAEQLLVEVARCSETLDRPDHLAVHAHLRELDRDGATTELWQMLLAEDRDALASLNLLGKSAPERAADEQPNSGKKPNASVMGSDAATLGPKGGQQSEPSIDAAQLATSQSLMVDGKLAEDADSLESTSNRGFLGGEELREALRVHQTQTDAFSQQLGRKRKQLGDNNWKEVINPLPNAPKYLYRSDANEIIELAKPYKKPKLG